MSPAAWLWHISCKILYSPFNEPVQRLCLSLGGDRKIHLQADTTSVVFYPDMDHSVTSDLSLLFDGLLQQAITGNPSLSGCPTTTPSSRPWIRLDLKGLFTVRRLTVSSPAGTAEGYEVRVGNSLINSGLDNYECGTTNSMNDFTCNAPQLARYVVITRTTQEFASAAAGIAQVQLAVCEIELFVYDDSRGGTMLPCLSAITCQCKLFSYFRLRP